MDADATDTARSPRGGFWNNLATGLKVVASELRWIVLGRVRAFEIRQLRRRLEREYEALGRLCEPLLKHIREGKKGRSLSPEAGEKADLLLKQIEFLNEEIAQLEDERLRSRRLFERQRARELGLEPEPENTREH